MIRKIAKELSKNQFNACHVMGGVSAAFLVMDTRWVAAIVAIVLAAVASSVAREMAGEK